MTEANPPKVYFDSNVLIAAFEGATEISKPLKDLFACLRAVPFSGVTSELTLAEALGREADAGWVWQKRFYLGLLVWGRFVDLLPVSRDILEETGEFRRTARASGKRHKLPDAIHLVSAVASGCSIFMTSDKHLSGSVPFPLRHVFPDKTGAASVRAMLLA